MKRDGKNKTTEAKEIKEAKNKKNVIHFST